MRWAVIKSSEKIKSFLPYVLIPLALIIFIGLYSNGSQKSTKLEYYYPTQTSTEYANYISPKFRICSGYGRLGEVRLSKEMYGKSVIKSYVLTVELMDSTLIELYVNIDDKTDYALLSYRNLTALKNENSADFFTNFVIYP